jgi:hypothetical protein
MEESYLNKNPVFSERLDYLKREKSEAIFKLRLSLGYAAFASLWFGTSNLIAKPLERPIQKVLELLAKVPVLETLFGGLSSADFVRAVSLAVGMVSVVGSFSFLARRIELGIRLDEVRRLNLNHPGINPADTNSLLPEELTTINNE